MRSSFLPFLVLWATTAHAQIDARLLSAIQQNDPSNVQAALTVGYSPNATDSLGATPLMWACYKADTAVVKILIKAGANTECKGVVRVGFSAFYGNLTGLAAGLNKLTLLRYLIETLKLSANEPEYNPETKKNDGWTPAEWAAFNGHLTVLTYLDLYIPTQGRGAKVTASIKDLLGRHYYRIGQYEKALPLFLETLSTTERTLGKVHPSYAQNLNNLGELYSSMGRYEQALPFYRQALSITEQALGKKHPEYATSLNNLAGLYKSQGRYEQALPFYQEVLTIYGKALGENHPTYAIILNNLAGLYAMLGRYEQALPFYQQALTIREQALGKKHPSYATSLNNLGELYSSMGQYEQALPLYKQALSIREQAVGKNHPDYATGLNNLGNLYSSMGQYGQAIPLYKQALIIQEQAVGKNHPDYATSLNNLGNLYESTGRYEQALSLCQQALSILEQDMGKKHPNYATGLNNLAGLYEKMGQYQKAIPLLSITRQQYKAQLQQNIAILNEAAIDQFQHKFDYANLTYSVGYTARATALLGQHYTDALLSKGVGLLATQQLNNLLSKTQDTTTASIASQMQVTKQSINRQLTLPLAQQQGLDSLQRQANTLEQQLVMRLPEYAKAFKALAVEWPQVQAALIADEAAIEFVSFSYYHKRWTDSTCYAALVLRPGYAQPRFIFLGEQRQLDTLLTSGAVSPEEINLLYRGGKVEGTNNSSQLKRGQALSKLIWQPLDSLLQGVKTVFVSPAGRLHQIALAALPNPADASHQTRMADRFQIRQVGSTRVVALRNAQTEQLLDTRNLKTILYGGITYEADSVGLVRQAHREGVQQRLAYREATRSGTWNYLPGTQTEVDKLKQALPPAQTTLLTKEAATEASVRALSGHAPTILHIATHGFFFPDLPKPKTEPSGFINTERSQFEVSENPLLRSGLVMAGANYVWKGGKPIEGVEDGILTAYEVSNLDLRGTELVVLSACETALGKVQGSEGVYGLQRAFKMAGARYLLMSLWRVSDRETAEYMALFYGQMLKTGSVPQAYEFAQQQMRQRYPQEPFKWAAFVLVE